MYKLIFFWVLLATPLWTQSIGLGRPMKKIRVVTPSKQNPNPSPSPNPQLKLKLVEFRDAKLQNVLNLIEEQSGSKPLVIKNPSTDVSVRLENTTWQSLLKIIEDQVSP